MLTIRANRETLDDRFAVLGFTVNTEAPLCEIAVATDPALFTLQGKAGRKRSTFYSSRAQGLLRTSRNEAVWLLPPDVLRGFVGQNRLYFGVAAYNEGSAGRPAQVQNPGTGSLYVNISGLSERGLRRLGKPAPGMGSYGVANGSDHSLEWGGDAIAAARPAAPAPAPVAAPAPASNAPAAQELAYSDGYDDGFWSPPSQAQEASEALDIVEPIEPASGWFAGVLQRLRWVVERESWLAGVPDTRIHPHAAICKLIVTRNDGSVVLGSGFYIAWKLILTAGHVIHNARSVVVIPGMNGTGNEPFGRATSTAAAGDIVLHDRYDGPAGDHDIGLIRTSLVAPNGSFFHSLEEQSRLSPEKLVVCGYSVASRRVDAIATRINTVIDPNKQHMHAGTQGPNPTPDTLTYNVQTLAGASGSPVYWVEQRPGRPDRIHPVGVHSDARDGTTNIGCRITLAKLTWIADKARALGLGFVRAMEAPTDTADLEAPPVQGMEAGEPIEALDLVDRMDLPSDPPTGWFDAILRRMRWVAEGVSWWAGVPDTSAYPHFAICKLLVNDASGNVVGGGTGFYIGWKLILTAGHVVRGAHSITVIPGMKGAGTAPYGKATSTAAAGDLVPHPLYNGVPGSDFDLALIRTSLATLRGSFIRNLEVMGPTAPDKLVVCGYSAESRRSSAIAKLVNDTIDPFKQHLHAGRQGPDPTPETMTYNVQTLAGASGSPVYWVEQRPGKPDRVHTVGVHVDGENNVTNRGCRLSEGKIKWIAAEAKRLGVGYVRTLAAPSDAMDADGASSPYVSMPEEPQQPSTALELLTRPAYAPRTGLEALKAQARMILESIKWFAGVSDTRLQPHSSICKLLIKRSNGRTGQGTGFYIGPNVLLTAGHNLVGAESVVVIPGKNGGGTTSTEEPFGRETSLASRGDLKVPIDWVRGTQTDIGLIRTSLTAPGGHCFTGIEELLQSRPEPVVVCGYSVSSRRTDPIGVLVNASIDGDKQHLHAGRVTSLPGSGLMAYDIQTLRGNSGSPVYWVEDCGGTPVLHTVGVHIAAHDEVSNKGAALNPKNRAWIKAEAARLGVRISTALELGADAEADDSFALELPAEALGAGEGPAVELKFRAFIPSRALPAVSLSGSRLFGGDHRDFSYDQGTSRAEIHATVRVGVPGSGGTVTLNRRFFGESTEYDYGLMQQVAGKPDWFKTVPDGTQPIARATLPATDANLKIEMGSGGSTRESVFSLTEGSTLLHIHLASALPLMTGAPEIDATLYVHLKVAGGRILACVNGSHDGFPAYEIYANRTRIYSYSPVTANESPTALLPPEDRKAGTSWIDIGPATPPGTTRSQAADEDGSDGAQKALPPVEAQGLSEVRHQVYLVPQPDKNACWAAAMTMLLNFRRKSSTTPEAVVREVGGSLASSYSWDLLEKVRDRYGFVAIRQPDNASLYISPEQWQRWLSAHGPLWVVIVGAPHAVVISGIRERGGKVEVEVLNPWDTRQRYDADPIAFRPSNAGYQSWQPFERFASDFGRMSQNDYGKWRVLHLPAQAVTRSQATDDQMGGVVPAEACV